MSIFTCEHCDADFDSAKQPYSVTGSDDTVICENCAESAWDRQQERLMEDGPGPSLIEQQREAWRLK
jgi:hypothetical protein